jgi:glutathione S-transferase
MTLTFYYGSGSPYAWRVWFALEHKSLAYDLRTISLSDGDHKKPEFLKYNPRHRVPVIVDGDFSLYESAAILEYLDEQYSSGPPLFPGDAKRRAVIRRLVREADAYVAEAMDPLIDLVLFTKRENWDPQAGPECGRIDRAETRGLDEADRSIALLRQDHSPALEGEAVTAEER